MLHFFEKGQGHPLIFLHGFCESGEMWRYFVDSLSTQYRVLCPDLPGFGNSPLTSPITSLEQVALQLEEWLDALQIQNPIVMGHSLGGYVALLAPEVQNAGVVLARAGTVALAAGEVISLQVQGGGLAGITTTPSTIATLIENKLAVQAPDGQIILSAVALNKLQAGVIKNSGSLEANSLVAKGGKIYLEGDDITLAATTDNVFLTSAEN